MILLGAKCGWTDLDGTVTSLTLPFKVQQPPGSEELAAEPAFLLSLQIQLLLDRRAAGGKGCSAWFRRPSETNIPQIWRGFLDLAA